MAARPGTRWGITCAHPLAGFFVFVPVFAAAQTVTTSAGPDAVAVAIYRAPARAAATAMALDDLQGYAFVTETRRVTVPAGDGTIRFEGVAGSILPESAIVTGLPEGVVEKNQDANLLSPASLLGAAVGRQVIVRRTSRATGQVREQSAVIRSGPGGQVVLQTAAGYEALRCTGIPETIVYETLPAGLSAKPVLSVRTHSDRGGMATVTLSYLADRFDWQANYVARLDADGTHLDLFGWVTLASADETSFVSAQAAVIAGKVNRGTDRVRRVDPLAPAIDLTCWPHGTTRDGVAPQVLTPAPVMAMAMARAEDIVVTSTRRKFAAQEDLGDLKFYRLPEPVTVAAKAQKQVALLERARVPVTLVYRLEVDGAAAPPVRMALRTRNRTAEHLGLPLPAGKVAVYVVGARQLLLGEGSTDDKAIGEIVEIDIATVTGVIAHETETAKGRYRLTLTNANARAVAVEAKFGERHVQGERLKRVDGAMLWAGTVPPNGITVIDFSDR